MQRRTSFFTAVVALILAAASLSTVSAPPAQAHEISASDYQQVTLARSGAEVGEPMSFTVLPDRSVLHTSRTGNLRRTDKDGNTTVIGHLDVYNHDEEGLQGIAADPDFENNRRVFIYYAPASADVSRLSMFTLNPDFTLDPASEQQILDVGASRGLCCHVGGAMDFDAAGNLYLSTGDDTNPFDSGAFTPIDERPGREGFDAQRTSANTNDLRGKILRIKVNDDGSYSIPEGNLFAPGTPKARPEIYAMGLRNPFRMTVDKATGIVYVGDYGPDAGSTSDSRGPAGQVEFNRITEAGNFGWPYCTGTNTEAETYVDYDFATGASGDRFDCANPVNESPNNTGLTTLPPAQPSWIRYGGDAGSPPEFGSGGEGPMAGPVYNYDPDNPLTTKFPEELDGVFFAGEFSRGWIKAVHMESDGAIQDIATFPETVVAVMDMKFGPDGSLYVLDYGNGWFSGAENAALYRFDYVGPSGNRAPIAQASGDPAYGHAPLAVNFSSAGSSDPDGDPLTYAWDFGDGATSTEANPTHTYTADGTYQATLTVSDGEATGSTSVFTGIGNTPPEVTASYPVDGQLVSLGDVVPFQVTATDAEDGSNPACERMTMDHLVRHDTPPTSHTHGLSTRAGCAGWITVEDADEGDAARVFPVFAAHYTDSEGLPGVDTVTVQLRRRQAEHYDESSGVNTYSKVEAKGGMTVGDIDNGDWISFAPYRLEHVSSFTARVSSGGVGGTLEVRAGSPTGPVLGSATVENTGSWETFTTVSGDLAGAAAETTTLYLTFSGGSGKLFDVDEFTFATAGPVHGLAGTCLDVQGGNTANGTQIQLWDCNGTSAQSWERVGQTLQVMGKCLDVNGAATHDGAKVQLYDCNGTGAQNWVQGTDGSLVNPNSGKCLDVKGASSESGTEVHLWTCWGGTNQKWSLS